MWPGLFISWSRLRYPIRMSFPIRVCVVCQEEFELKPNKPGFANRCPSCSEPEETGPSDAPQSAEERQAEAEANEARRKAIRDLLYRGDS
jgi:hypothetical protein